jgi:HlyD family secretion protein
MSDSQGLGADTSTRIFRDAALERLNSPEQLDQRIGVIPPAMRLLAAWTEVIIVAALAWPAFGSVATRVIGRGVLIADKEGNYAMAPISSGLASIELKLLRAQIDDAMVRVEAAQVRQSDETAKSLLRDVAPLLARIELVPAKHNPSGSQFNPALRKLLNLEG